MTSRTGASRLLAALAALALVALTAVVATAHAELVRAIPADGATVTEPVTAITARYSEDLATGSSLNVIDASGAAVATGGIDASNRRLMIARPETPLTNGTFTVRSTAIAADGHVERTDWAFSVEIPATPEPTPTATDQPSPPATTSPTPVTMVSPTVVPTPTPSASTDTGTPASGGGDVVLPIIAALAIVLIAGLLLSRGRRSGPPG